MCHKRTVCESAQPLQQVNVIELRTKCVATDSASCAEQTPSASVTLIAVRSVFRRDCQFRTHNPSPSQHIRLDTCVLAILAVVQKHSYLSRALPELVQEVVAREISEA